MFASCKQLSNSSRNWVRNSIQKVKAKDTNKGKSQKLLSSGVDWITSSFAAMEVSNQLKQVFKIIDANGDGKISSLELGEVLLCLGHEKATVAKEAEGMVSVVDYNGDGFIDLDEFMEVVVGGGNNENEYSKDDSLLDAFHVFDSDKNGFISAKELMNVFISLGYDKCTLRECSLMIQGVDKDGDGLVDFEEFRSMMTGR
ncbi:Calmodulin [Thalictrum thalictroides]|uniref:Calmodulin n=1 Tax=Thalictrum thalictroides TaxID=46969 RepID=A0A7J6VJA8_THATH|nr:Calmodulin [Thalictrum thalictroides]